VSKTNLCPNIQPKIIKVSVKKGQLKNSEMNHNQLIQVQKVLRAVKMEISVR
jgi:hypothetical protein